MNKKQISEIVDSWIDEKELPVNQRLKVIRKFDDVYPEDWDEDEFEAYWDFIKRGLTKEYELLFTLPKPENECNFWPFQFDETGHDISAFTTTDFICNNPYTFNREFYKVKKVYERVKDTAIGYSSISHREGKKNMHERFRKLVEIEFQDEAFEIKKQMKHVRDRDKRRALYRTLFKLSCRIQECNEIWRKYAYWK